MSTEVFEADLRGQDLGLLIYVCYAVLKMVFKVFQFFISLHILFAFETTDMGLHSIKEVIMIFMIFCALHGKLKQFIIYVYKQKM